MDLSRGIYALAAITPLGRNDYSGLDFRSRTYPLPLHTCSAFLQAGVVLFRVRVSTKQILPQVQQTAHMLSFLVEKLRLANAKGKKNARWTEHSGQRCGEGAAGLLCHRFVHRSDFYAEFEFVLSLRPIADERLKLDPCH